MVEINEYIDHTILRPNITDEDIHEFCMTACKYKFASVCVPPNKITFIENRVGETPICTVIGFPLGFQTIYQKMSEMHEALMNGAQELDIVLNIGNIVEEDWRKVDAEISYLCKVSSWCTLKLIIETCYLTPNQIRVITTLMNQHHGVKYIKTSTGYGSRGASLQDIATITEGLFKGSRLKIKASGGIKTLDDALTFINCGCDRIGTSNAKSIMEEFLRRKAV